MVALIATSCAGGPGTGGRGEVAAWSSLTGGKVSMQMPSLASVQSKSAPYLAGGAAC